MKGVFKVRRYLSFEGDAKTYPLEDYEWRYLEYEDVKDVDPLSIVYSTWEGFIEMVKSETFWSLYYRTNFFGNRVHYDFYNKHYYLTEKKFTKAAVKFSIRKIERFSMKDLMEKLPAKDFVEWKKDNGLEK